MLEVAGPAQVLEPTGQIRESRGSEGRGRGLQRVGTAPDLGRAFGGEIRAYVPEMERDVTGLPAIERLAGIMYGQ